jgi:hypothetical protein
MSVAPLEQSWYPSCVVKLTIRFDESLHVRKPRDEVAIDSIAAQTQEARITGEVTVETPSGPVKRKTGKHRMRRWIEDELDGTERQFVPDDPDGTERAAFIAQRRKEDNLALGASDRKLPSSAVIPGAGPINRRGADGFPGVEVEPLTFGTDSFTVIANRVPKKGSFMLPHPRSAPTFSLTFDYAEFPIAAELIRAVGVEIHLGAVPADDFARGMRGEVDSDGRPLSILKTTTDIIDPVTGRKGLNEGTLLFYGTVDTWDVEHSNTGSVLMMEGREVRSILIDTKIVPSKIAKVDLKQSITFVIADIIQTIPFENGFRLCVATDATEWPNGQVPSPGTADGMTKVRIKAASRKGAKVKSASGGDPGVQTGDDASGRSTPSTGSGTSYWDLITNYCELVGGMPYIVGSMLWIRPVHRVFDIVDPNSKIPTPFSGGTPRQVGEEPYRVRRMVLGRNIRRFVKQRKFGGVAIVPTVQCISSDDRVAGTQRLIFGQWPPAGGDAAESKGDGELLRVPMWGIRSVDQLTRIARGIYEEIGRGETGGTVDTSDLASFGGDNADPDILRCRPLEPIEFLVDASARRAGLPIAASVNDLERMSFSEEVEYLHKVIGDLAVARAMVALQRGAVLEVIRYYQIVQVGFEWDKGVKTSLSFQNYIIPRHFEAAASDKSQTAPADIRTTAVKVAGAQRKAKRKYKPKTNADFERDFKIVPVDPDVELAKKRHRERRKISNGDVTFFGGRGLQ